MVEAQASPQHDRGGLPPTLHDRGGVTAPSNVNVAAYESEALAIASAMEAGLVTGPNGIPLPQSAQHSVLASLHGLDSERSLAGRLSHGNDPQAHAQAVVLTELLQGLLRHPGQLAEVALAFNALIDASSDEFLLDPPPELLAVRSSLARLIHAAASER
jgi:hypothetical protein